MFGTLQLQLKHVVEPEIYDIVRLYSFTQLLLPIMDVHCT